MDDYRHSTVFSSSMVEVPEVRGQYHVELRGIGRILKHHCLSSR